MMHGTRRFLLILASSAALFAAACSSEDAPHFPAPTPGTDAGVPPRAVSDGSVGVSAPDAATSDAASPSTGDASTEDSALANPTLQVKVTVDSPKDDSLIVVRNEFAPVVTVVTDTPSPGVGDLVTSVTAELRVLLTHAPVGSLTKLNQVGLEGTPETNIVTYHFAKTPVDLSGLESGIHELVVTAKTAGGAQGTATVRVIIDAGPSIRINEPLEGGAYVGSADVNATITDSSFAVTKVTATIGQTEIPLTGPSMLGLYTGKIDFASFDPPLVGDQLLTIRARNQNQTEAIVVRKFVSDNQGPMIANVVPKVGDLVGRVVQIAADITDPRGVNDSTAKVVISHGNDTYEFPLIPPAPGSMTPTYTYVFDSSKLPINALFPSITFRAKDKLGNESVISYLVSLDNMPPLSEIDPPPDMRLRIRPTSTSAYQCSWDFDPVGADTIDDGDRVQQLFDIRARVEDQGNEPKAGVADFTPISTVDTVDLLILDDTTKALVVDTKRRVDGPVANVGNRDDLDGYCDELNPNLKVSANPASSPDVLLITMAPLSPTGSGDFIPDPALPIAGVCNPGDQSQPPSPVCETTVAYAPLRAASKAGRYGAAMTTYISYASSKLAAVWTVPPIVSDGLQCAGRQFDSLANKVNDGWACLAVRATDKLGNQQVSRVLRVCLDHDNQGNECPHKFISDVALTSPMAITTTTPHGLSTGDEVIVNGVFETSTPGARFTAEVVSDTVVNLIGTPKSAPVVGSTLVAVKLMPSCSAGVTAAGPPAVLDQTKTCAPWRTYSRGEIRDVK